MAKSWYLQGGFTSSGSRSGPKSCVTGRGARLDRRTARGGDGGLETGSRGKEGRFDLGFLQRVPSQLSPRLLASLW